ncbi:hypothetical protein V6N13_037475 [Hibiscus sabdariffa]
MHDVVGEVVVEVLMEDAMFRLLDIVLLVRVFGEGIIAKGVEEHTEVFENGDFEVLVEGATEIVGQCPKKGVIL